MLDNESRGALCGRMLAQLESAQHAALGDLNRNVVDRYYSAASVTPERVFPRLLADVHMHLRKAGRTGKRAAEIAISRRLGELAQQLQALGGLPSTFTLEEQADFALGYWTERQRRFAGSSADGEPAADPMSTTTDEESDQ